VTKVWLMRGERWQNCSDLINLKHNCKMKGHRIEKFLPVLAFAAMQDRHRRDVLDGISRKAPGDCDRMARRRDVASP